ncbi:MAG: PleD family two-component system response regulator [Promethearchaeota archaeon]
MTKKEKVSRIIKEDEYPYDILIVNDDIKMIEILNEYFNKEGYSCKGFISGAKVLNEVQNFHPKLILLDIILTDSLGYDICKSIKKDHMLKNIPVFYATGMPRSEVKNNLEETKANGFFLEPFDLKEFDILIDYLRYFKKREEFNVKYDILLVYPYASDIKIIQSIFVKKGYSCKAVISGIKAIEELIFFKPKLILIYIMLPDISGFDVCKKIKSAEWLKDIPVFFISSWAESEVEKHLEETKANGYVLCPFREEDFDFIDDFLK